MQKSWIETFGSFSAELFDLIPVLKKNSSSDKVLEYWIKTMAMFIENLIVV